MGYLLKLLEYFLVEANASDRATYDPLHEHLVAMLLWQTICQIGQSSNLELV